MLKVILLSSTPNPQSTIAAAAKLCYWGGDMDSLTDGITEENSGKFIKKLVDMGHESPLEHVSFTFGIEGVSRTLMAQITRHRIASFSIQSQRYVKKDNFEIITPPEIAKSAAAKKIFDKTMESIRESYNHLYDILRTEHKATFMSEGMSEKEATAKADKLAGEDARFVLPGACDTKIIMTMNVRSLYNLFSLRLCNRAQWEIREMTEAILRICKTEAPLLFKNCAPECVFGTCPEGAMTCNKMAEVKKKYLEG